MIANFTEKLTQTHIHMKTTKFFALIMSLLARGGCSNPNLFP